jgi:hypothetical protein
MVDACHCTFVQTQVCPTPQVRTQSQMTTVVTKLLLEPIMCFSELQPTKVSSEQWETVRMLWPSRTFLDAPLLHTVRLLIHITCGLVMMWQWRFRWGEHTYLVWDVGGGVYGNSVPVIQFYCEPMLGKVVSTCSPSYSGSWGRRITGAQKFRTSLGFKESLSLWKIITSQAPVAHTYNPIYLGGWDQNAVEDSLGKEFQSKIDWRCSSSDTASVLQVWSPKFEPQVCPPQKK